MKITYKISDGFDHYNGYPLYRVIGGDYIGEWHTIRQDAEDELSQLSD